MERKHVALLVLLILAIATRFFGIELQSLWGDEGATYYYSHYTWDQFLTANEPNSPIYYFMVGKALDILGHSEFAMRFVSAVAGIVVVMMSYFITEKMFKNWRFSILVAILFLISAFCLGYSQEARGYELVLMFFMLQFYVFLYAMETRKIIFWLLFILFGLASFAMQYTAALATVTLLLYALYIFFCEMRESGNYRPLLYIAIACVALVVLSCPFWNIAIDALISHTSASHIEGFPVGIFFVVETVLGFLSKISIIAVVMLVLMVIGVYSCRKNHMREYILLLWVMLFPLISMTIASLFINISPRYIIWSILPYLIFVAMSFYFFGTDSDMLKRANAVAVVSVVLVSAIVLPIYYTETTKVDFRGAASELSANATEGDVVIYAPPWENMTYATLSFYYVPSDYGVTALPYSSIQQIKDVASDPNYGNVYILICHHFEPYDYIMEHWSESFTEIFSGYEIHLFLITGPLDDV